MSDLLALDVAILPPASVRERAVSLSAALPDADFEGLRLDHAHQPHITLTQQFVDVDELDRAFERLDGVLRGRSPFTIHVTGVDKTGASAVCMAIARTDVLVSLHERLMETLKEFEHVGGGAAAFVDRDAREADVAWVTGYRLHSSFLSYAPHITLGHASRPSRIEPFTFQATTVAACHLGRFCTCQRVLRQWELIGSAQSKGRL
jgi:2'-5' RNA ligase